MILAFRKSDPLSRVIDKLLVRHLFDENAKTSFHVAAYNTTFTVEYSARREEITVTDDNTGEIVIGKPTFTHTILYHAKDRPDAPKPKDRLVMVLALQELAKIV